MAEVQNSTLDSINALESQNIEALRQRIEAERLSRISAARGQAISRGLQGSSFETRAISEINRLANQALNDGEREIKTQFNNQRVQIEESELNRRWQSLEEEKTRAFNAGETEKARQFAEQQAQIQRDADAMNARRESRAQLTGTAAQLGTVALLNKGLFGGGNTSTPGTAGVFNTTLNKTGQALFGSGANVAPGASGPALPTFGQGFSMPYAKGVAPGGSGAVGQAVGTAAGIVGGSYAGQKVADSIFGQKYNTDQAVSRGGKAGAAAGSTIGTALFGPAGGVAGGTIGGVVGANAGEGLRNIASSGAGASDNKGITVSNLFQGAVKKPLETVGGIIGGGAGVKVAQKVQKLFCFTPDTLIKMANGSEKAIGDIQLEDETLGGIVESIRVSITDDLYDYMGVGVSGGHAVLEDESWTRVSNAARSVPVPGKYEVISLVTSKHRIYANGTIFADEFETDNYEWLNLDESLAALNAQPREALNGAAFI